MTEQVAVVAITKAITVARPPGDAFRTFVGRIDDWWPREYALGGERTERIVLEPREGGRVYELDTDGAEHPWGTVLVYEPPTRLVLSWGLNGSQVEVRFSANDGGTRVELEHRGWENLEDGQERAQYDAGWDVILARYVHVAATAGHELRKTVRVASPPAEAFRLFTESIGTWWPLATHSVEEENAETVVFETGIGGRIYERSLAGGVHHWGTVLEWEPPSRFVCTWHPSRGPSTAQRLEIRFLPNGDGTRVELVHTGWEALGPLAPARRDGYDSGWDYILRDRFAAVAR